MKLRTRRPAARQRVASPLKVDPSRTAMLRKMFAAEVGRRFARFKLALVDLVEKQDAFGLLRPADPFAANAFCPTGPGGGIDPSCSPGKAAGQSFYAQASGRLSAAAKRYDKLLAGLKGGKIDLPTFDQKVYETHWSLKDALDRGLARRARGLTGGHDFGPDRATVREFADAYVKAVSGYGRRLAETGKTSAAARREVEDARADLSRFIAKTADRMTVNRLALNSRWRGLPPPDQLREFKAWVAKQLNLDILATPDAEIWRRYAEAGFRKGAGRAFDDVNRSRRWAPGEGDFYRGSREQFLRDSFARPVAAEKVQLLAARVYDDLEGITSQMSAAITRTLADGLVQGKNPRDIARDLAANVDVSRKRAEVMARDSIIRTHAEGQLTAMENLGVEEVGAAVEWLVTKDAKLCRACAALEGVVLTIAEARGLLPRHPACRCAWVPNVQKTPDEKRSKAAVEAAVRASLKAQPVKGAGGYAWPGAAVDIDPDRPKPLLNAAPPPPPSPALLEFSRPLNVFCPTGPGGGVDPTCKAGGGPSAGGAGPAADSLALYRQGKRDEAWQRHPDPPMPGQSGAQYKRLTDTLWLKRDAAGKVRQESHASAEYDLGDALKALATPQSRVREGRPPFPVDTNPPYTGTGALTAGQVAAVPVRRVPLAGLIATQERVNAAHVLAEAAKGPPVAVRPVLVVRVPDGRSYLDDGTHRAAAAVLRGEDSIDARVFEWDGMRLSPTANVFCPTGPGGGVDPTCSPGGAGTKSPGPAASRVLSSAASTAEARGQAALEAAVRQPGWQGPKDARAVKAALDKVYEESELTVNFRTEYAGGFADRPKVLNAYEAGNRSAGYMKTRRAQEESVFGAGEVPDADRPVYAAVNFGANAYGAASVYGNGVIVLNKDAVKGRMTMTSGNSFGHRDGRGVGTHDYPHAALAGNGRALEAAGIPAKQLAVPQGYTEVQVWGGLSLSKETVKEIRMPSLTAGEKGVQRLVEWGGKAGVPVKFFHEQTGDTVGYEQAREWAAKAPRKNKGLVAWAKSLVGG